MLSAVLCIYIPNPHCFLPAHRPVPADICQFPSGNGPASSQ